MVSYTDSITWKLVPWELWKGGLYKHVVTVVVLTELSVYSPSQLVHKKAIESYTSIKENVGHYPVTGQRSMILEVIDIPGNERQRLRFWDQFKNQAR